MLNPWPCKPQFESSSTFYDIYTRKSTHTHSPACPKRRRHTVVAARRTETWRRERNATEGLMATTGARTDCPCATDAVEGLKLSVCACHMEEGEHLLLGPRRNRCRFERHCPTDLSGPQLPAWCEDRATKIFTEKKQRVCFYGGCCQGLQFRRRGVGPGVSATVGGSPGCSRWC